LLAGKSTEMSLSEIKAALAGLANNAKPTKPHAKTNCRAVKTQRKIETRMISSFVILTAAVVPAFLRIP